MNILDRAVTLLGRGFSVLPIMVNGSKKPTIPWKKLQSRCLTSAEAAGCFNDRVGIGILGGHVSGGLEVIDFDALGFFDRWREAVKKVAPGLLERLPHVITPTGGHHIYLRHHGNVDGNCKLAYTRAKDGSLSIAVETRGEGGYVLTVGSPARCHQYNEIYDYAEDSVSIEDTPTLTKSERDILVKIAQSLDETPPCPSPQADAFQPTSATGTRPGEEFAAKTPWAEILEPHGWRFSHKHAGLAAGVKVVAASMNVIRCVEWVPDLG